MFNPLDTIRRFQSRIGKPIRPIVEFQKECSLVNVLTTTVQTENLINDPMKTEAWEVHPDDQMVAVYVDGLFKGMGYVAGEEGVILKVKKEVRIEDKKGNDITLSYKGIIGKLLDASLYERGSALKPSMMQTLIYCALVGLLAFMMGMSYGN